MSLDDDEKKSTSAKEMENVAGDQGGGESPLAEMADGNYLLQLKVHIVSFN